MGSKTRLSSYCTKRANNGVNLVTSRNINTRLAPYYAKFDRKILYTVFLNDYSSVFEISMVKSHPSGSYLSVFSDPNLLVHIFNRKVETNDFVTYKYLKKSNEKK